MRYVTESETVVFTKAVNGDTEAFGHLVYKYSNAVYATAFQVVRDFHRSEDIAQETFIRAWYNLGRIREVDKFGSWLYTTAKRISIDFLRKENKYHLKTVDDLEHVFQAESTEEIALRNERQTLVWEAISQLTDGTLSYMTQMEIVSRFGRQDINCFNRFMDCANEDRCSIIQHDEAAEDRSAVSLR